MSLNWQWNAKKGYVTSDNLAECPNWKCWLYHGNALMILIDEHEDGKQWQMHSFFVDNEHAKRCLEDGIFTKDHVFHLYRDKSNKKLAKLLASYYVDVVWEDEECTTKEQ